MPVAEKQPIIVAEKLGKRVPSPEGELILLHDIDLRIDSQEAVAVLGASGAGKSTLLAMLAGLDTPSAGHVRLDGVDIFSLDEDGRARLRGAKVGFVFQSFHLLPNLTAIENVMLPLELSGGADAMSRAKEVLGRVGLATRLHHYPRQLSGGEQQRVAIARAFVTQPKILFADEPTGNLDNNTGQRIIDLLFTMNRDHAATLVLVTHDESLAKRCGRRLLLEAGRLIQDTRDG